MIKTTIYIAGYMIAGLFWYAVITGTIGHVLGYW